jgi:hypothetical protein
MMPIELTEAYLIQVLWHWRTYKANREAAVRHSKSKTAGE